MADVKISALPAATTPLAGTELVPIVQGGVTEQVTVANLTAGRDIAASGATISGSSATDLVRITQTGAGNALVVEDSANPDSTPIVIDSAGLAAFGNTQAVTTQTATARVQSFAIGSFSGITAGATASNAATIDLSRSRGTVTSPTAVSSGDNTGRVSFGGHDGTAYIEAAKIETAVDGTPGANSMPGRLVLSTTASGSSSPTERMRIDNAGQVGIGGTPVAGTTLTISKNITGATGSYAIRINGVAQSDATTAVAGILNGVGTAAASFTTTNLYQYYTTQGTFGAGSFVTNQYGYFVSTALVGAANNYGFYSSIAAGTSRTITNVERTSNVVTITTSVAHGYTAGQSVTVAATTNTGVNGTFTIASVPTTTTFTYAQTAADIPSGADTGTTVVVGRWNFYANGTAPNYFAGITSFGGTDWYALGTTTTPRVQITGTGASGTTLSVVGWNSVGGTLSLSRSNGAAVGTRGVVASSNTVGALNFYGDDGTAFVPAASIIAAVDGTPGTNDMPGRLGFYTTLDGAATTTERLRIANNGFTTLQSGALGRAAPVTKTGDFTLGTAENWLICNGSGTITVTLPAASSWTGREVMIKTIAAQTVVSASSNVVPLAGGAAGTAILAATAGKFATLVSDGTNWIIMQAN